MATNSLTLKGNNAKTEEESLSNTSLDDIPDDILFEILVRLPDCRSVIQSCLVTKRWFSLIFSPQLIPSFIDHHRQCQVVDSPPYTFLVQGRSYHFPFYHVFSKKSSILYRGLLPSSYSSTTYRNNYLEFFPEPMVISASFEDLLLVSPSSSSLNYDQNYYICNPLTRQCLELPAIPFRRKIPCGFGLVCERAQHTITRFRVVLLYSFLSPPRSSDQLAASIFCSETGKWSESFVTPPPHLTHDQEFSPLCQMCSVDTKVGVACNGSLHWLILNYVYSTVCVIVALNPFDETNRPWRFIAPPADLYNPRLEIRYYRDQILYLGVCQNRLRAYLIPKLGGPVIWELLDNNDDDTSISWSLVHDARFGAERGVRYYGLGLHPNKGDVVFLSSGDRVFRFNVSKGVVEKVHKFAGEIDPQLSVFPLVHPPWPTPIPSL